MYEMLYVIPYPKLERTYQAAQNLAVFHLKEGCNHAPRDVRSKIGLFRERKSASGGGKRSWAEDVRARGVAETPSGLCFLSQDTIKIV